MILEEEKGMFSNLLTKLEDLNFMSTETCRVLLFVQLSYLRRGKTSGFLYHNFYSSPVCLISTIVSCSQQKNLSQQQQTYRKFLSHGERGIVV